MKVHLTHRQFGNSPITGISLIALARGLNVLQHGRVSEWRAKELKDFMLNDDRWFEWCFASGAKLRFDPLNKVPYIFAYAYDGRDAEIAAKELIAAVKAADRQHKAHKALWAFRDRYSEANVLDYWYV